MFNDCVHIDVNSVNSEIFNSEMKKKEKKSFMMNTVLAIKQYKRLNSKLSNK